jgi:3-oxoacyl-[acyl-carrier-protein] synthase-1
MNKVAYLNSLGIVSALGIGKAETVRRLLAGNTSGMIRDSELLIDGSTFVGSVAGKIYSVPSSFANQNSRNNQLLLTATEEIRGELDAAIDKYGPDRIGVVLGTSTSGISEGELAIDELDKNGVLPDTFDYKMWEMGSPAIFLSEILGIYGPSYVVSTACSSSAKALVSARNILMAGLCDAVITGGVDSLCRLTLNGFKALETISPELMNPMSVNRKGLNIGEGAAVFLMSREPSDLALLGTGESSDAYHFSAPDPEGIGAVLAMNAALNEANVDKNNLCYLNLHGTATQKNDEMEAKAVVRVFPNGIPSSSTKPLTGHTLGAAGAIEAAFCWLVLSDFNIDGVLPPHIWDGSVDACLPPIDLVPKGKKMKGPKFAMSNSFAFGGSNASLIVGEIK